jgi:uncharacterized membrane protein YkgB
MHKVFSIKQERSAAYPAVAPVLSIVMWGNRIALSIVFFWFGFLKIIHISPAEALVAHLHRVTIARVIPIETFLLLLGAVECTIGILWLIPKATKFVFSLFIIQMLSTFLPLVFLKTETWQQSFVLTLAGQYIIKNLVLVASAVTVLFGHYQRSGVVRTR